MSSYVKTTYEYSKLRKNYGRQPLFQTVPAQMLDSVNPSKEDQKDYMLRNPVHRAVQAVLPMSENEINTPFLESRDQGMNHLEGGWPKDVQPSNEEHTLRHRRRIMHDESYCESILRLAPSMMHYIDQNNAIEMYQIYFDNMQHQESKETYSIRVANVFRDIHQRPISCVKFTNESNPKLAVAYCYKTSMPNSALNNVNSCYFWDIHKQMEPLFTLNPEYPCWQLACSPIKPDLLLLGLENGTINLFDIRQSDRAISASYIHNSHRESITSLRFIHSRTHTDFFSGSSDGQCLWWDLRKLSAPLDQLPISIRIAPGEEPNLGNAEGVSFLEYDDGLPTKFLCGTESGLVVNVNRLGRSHSDKLMSYWQAHNGPVQAVQRSGCTFRMFLTCGDYTVRIWSEEIRTAPIIVTNPYKYLVTDACWAPIRYSSYMSICAGGFFYFWDLLRKYKEPVNQLKLSDHVLTKMAPQSEGKLVAAGDSHGSLFLVQLSENMAIPGIKDRFLMQQIYERETRREHILDNRLKEIRLKLRNEEQQVIDETTESVMEEEDEEDRITEEEYFKVVQEEIKNFDSFPDQVPDE